MRALYDLDDRRSAVSRRTLSTQRPIGRRRSRSLFRRWRHEVDGKFALKSTFSRRLSPSDYDRKCSRELLASFCRFRRPLIDTGGRKSPFVIDGVRSSYCMHPPPTPPLPFWEKSKNLVNNSNSVLFFGFILGDTRQECNCRLRTFYSIKMLCRVVMGSSWRNSSDVNCKMFDLYSALINIP